MKEQELGIRSRNVSNQWLACTLFGVLLLLEFLFFRGYAIMRAMQVKLTEGEQAALWHKKGAAKNTEAYEKYFQARMYIRDVRKDSNYKARQLEEEAIALDPSYAGYYSGLAYTHVMDARWGWSKDPAESLRQAYEIANKAISLDNSLDSPHYILAMIYMTMHEYDKMVAEGEKGVELNPNGAEALGCLGWFLNMAGRPAEAITVLDKAMRLNPIPPPFYYAWVGNSYTLMGEHGKAIAILEKGLRIQPDNAVCLMNLAAAYGLAGRREDARKTAAKFLSLNPKFSLEAWAKTYKDPAVQEQLINALRQAGMK